jgi:phosphoribosyl-dephospho-CoA transferase
MTPRLARHDLVWLSGPGWGHLLAGAHEPEVLACLEYWCAARLPLVVGRQQPDCADLASGLAAPLAWGRRKLALRVPAASILYHDRFPAAADVASLLPTALRARWSALIASLAELGVEPRVHGSYGWQRLTAQPYLRPGSDLDLHMSVADPHTADAVTERLEAFHWSGPRIDGELIFANGSAVAWREWLQWRRAAVDRILVKRLDGVALEQGLAWLDSRQELTA